MAIKMKKSFKMKILIIRVKCSMDKKWMIKTIIKTIILAAITSINKIHIITNGRNQIKIMIGRHQGNTVKIGVIIINSQIKVSTRVQDIIIVIVTPSIKMNGGIIKIVGSINNIEITIDRAIKNDMISILIII